MHTNQHSNCALNVPRAERIAQLNDELRKGGTGGQILITRGIQLLPAFESRALLERLAAFDEFDADSDPHGERDFGAIDLWDAELVWKIDYYAPDLLLGSNDPADPSQTYRILTVMLAEEY